MRKPVILSFFVALFLCTILLIYVRINANEKSDLEFDSNEQINLNKLFHIGRCLVEKAGEKIVQIRTNNELNVKNKVADKSIVTQADLRSHQVLVDSLQYKFKNLKIISEENSDEHSDSLAQSYVDLCSIGFKSSSSDMYVPLSQVNVWIDPLDATQEYSGILKSLFWSRNSIGYNILAILVV